jgi:hypothetical protein
MRTTMGLVVGVALLAASCGADAPAGPPFRENVSVQMLMKHMIDPAADLLWGAVGTMVDAEGEHHWEPETEDEWISVRYAAMSLIESGNLLMMSTRARDQNEWIRLSESLNDAATEMFQATESEDADLVFDLGEKIYETCNNCHGLYWTMGIDPVRDMGE